MATLGAQNATAAATSAKWEKIDLKHKKTDEKRAQTRRYRLIITDLLQTLIGGINLAARSDSCWSWFQRISRPTVESSQWEHLTSTSPHTIKVEMRTLFGVLMSHVFRSVLEGFALSDCGSDCGLWFLDKSICQMNKFTSSSKYVLQEQTCVCFCVRGCCFVLSV